MDKRNYRTGCIHNQRYKDKSMEHRKKCLKPEILKGLRAFLQRNCACPYYIDLWYLPFEELEKRGIEKTILTDRAIENELASRRARILFEKIGIIVK